MIYSYSTACIALAAGLIAGACANLLPRQANATSTIYALASTPDSTSFIYTTDSTSTVALTMTVFANATVSSSKTSGSNRHRVADGVVSEESSSSSVNMLLMSVPPSGIGPDCASSCNDLKQAWIESPSIPIRTVTTTSVWTTYKVEYSSSYITVTNWNNNQSKTAYTLCDGYPRMDATLSISKSVIAWSTPHSGLTTGTHTVFRNVSAPACTIMPRHWAYNTNGIATTATSDSFLPQSSESVFSYCASTGGDFGEARPVNYADFQHPVPASEYRCQPHCWTRKYAPSYIDYTWSAGGRTGIGKTWTFDDVNAIATENQCSTIWDDFEPVLSIPPEFFSQQGREVWGSITCDFVIHGGNVFWDPPVALTPQSTVAGVSRPAGAQSAEATPTSGVTSQSAETGNMPGPTTPTPARGSEVTAEGALSQTNGPSESDTPVASPDIATVKESRSSSGVPGSATSRKKEGEPKVAGPPTPTTSRSIGDIIASVIGEVRPTTERPEQSDEGIAVSSEVEPAETGGGSSLGSGGGNDQDDGNGGDDGDSNGGNDNGSNGASTGGGESGSNSDNGSDHGSQGQQKEGSGEAGPVNDSGNNDRDDGYQEQDQGSEPAPTDTAGKVASILGAQVPHNAQDPQSTAHALGDGAGSTQGSQNDGSQPAPVASQGTDAGSGEDTQPAAAGVVLTGADGTVHTLIPSSVVVDPINREAPLTPAADQTIVISGVGTVVLQSSGTAVADSTQAYSAIELETLETLAAGSIVTNSDSEQYTITYDTAASGAVMTTIISGVGTVFIQPSGVVVDGSTQAYSPLKDEASTTLTPGQVVTAADGTPYTISHDAVASGDNLTTTASGLGPVVIQASATSASEAISDSADTKTTSPLGSGQGSIGGVSASGGAQLDSAGVSLLSRLLSTLGMLAATGLVAAWAM